MNELRYQHCAACGRAQTLRREACQYCGTTGLPWREASGRGVVHSVTVITRAPSDDFRPLVPYTLVLVDLEEGFRRMGHATPGVRIGDAVTAETFIHGTCSLLRFAIRFD